MLRNKLLLLHALILIICMLPETRADVKLPSVFGDRMVLQRNSEITIWGWAYPLEEVRVVTAWDHVEKKTMTRNDATWSLSITTPAAGGPYEIIIKGNNTITLKDILIGEVWLCSGQSNMEWSAEDGIENGPYEIKNANFPEIRLFQVESRSADYPQLDLEGEWNKCTPEIMKKFSAVGYFFARELNEKLNIPIGIIDCSWGGTPAETWMNSMLFSEDTMLSKAAKMIPDKPWCPTEPGKVYNGMIAPLVKFKIAGVIWYQGESNTDNADYYTYIFKSLIKNWRYEWNLNLPFYYVQIAPYEYAIPEVGVKVMEAQRLCLELPNTGMVVVNDIGNINDMHPRNKIDVGKRLANWALAKTYNIEGITYSGPLYKGKEIKGNKMRVFFRYAEKGLVSNEHTLSYFEIAGHDKVFYRAKAFIDGNTVIAHSDKVEKPVYIRFAWSNTAEPSLFNTDSLPASCFNSFSKISHQ